MLSFLLAVLTYTIHVNNVLSPPARPADSHRQPVSFRTNDGVLLRGWLYRPSSSSSTYVIFFYGSNEDLMQEQRRLQWLSADLHVNALCFDYRGYGFSQGTIDPRLIRSDVLAEYDYLVKA